MSTAKYVGYGKFKSGNEKFSAQLNKRNREVMKGAKIGDEFSFDFLQKGIKLDGNQPQMNKVTNLVKLSKKRK